MFSPSLYVCFTLSTFSYPAQEVSAWPGPLREPLQQGAISNRIPLIKQWEKARKVTERWETEDGKEQGLVMMSVWSRNEKWQQESGSPSKEHTEEDGRKKGKRKERRRGRKIDMTGCLFKILHIKSWHSLFNYETVWTNSLVSLGWSQYAMLRPNKFEYLYVQRILWRVEGWGGGFSGGG